MTVYLSGPMTGLPDFNRQAFIDGATYLRSLGLEVTDPVTEDFRVYGTWEEAIRHDWREHLARDIAVVPRCAEIFMLPGWEGSRGANLELRIARAFGLPAWEMSPSSDAVRWDIRSLSYDAIDVRYRPGDLASPPPLEATERSRRTSGGAMDDSSIHMISEGAYDGDRFVPYSENPERHLYETGAIKDNRSKTRLDLIPSTPLELAGQVLAHGAEKYKPNNWRYGLPWGDTFASMQRHLWAWQRREDKDKDTGISHLAHALCQLLFLVEYEATGTGTDDRWSPPDLSA